MKQNIVSFILLLVLTGTFFAGCNNNKKQSDMAQESTSLFPKGTRQPVEYFTGDAFLYPLLAKDKNNEFALGSVTFEPGARTHWHTHPKGQVLIITEGAGFYQERASPPNLYTKAMS